MISHVKTIQIQIQSDYEEFGFAPTTGHGNTNLPVGLMNFLIRI